MLFAAWRLSRERASAHSLAAEVMDSASIWMSLSAGRRHRCRSSSIMGLLRTVQVAKRATTSLVVLVEARADAYSQLPLVGARWRVVCVCVVRCGCTPARARACGGAGRGGTQKIIGRKRRISTGRARFCADAISFWHLWATWRGLGGTDTRRWRHVRGSRLTGAARGVRTACCFVHLRRRAGRAVH